MKRLVVCLDGTWNTPDEGANPTNVVKIMRAIRTHGADQTPQIVFYDKGVGTGGPIDRVRGGAMGRGLEDNVQDGYRFLVNNYEAGDEIYLFGFSRGAFTARSLAGFIGWMGLLEKGAMRELSEAWETYQSRDERGRDALNPLVRANVPVKCVGVWDSVGALGIPSKLLVSKKYRFHDTSLGDHIEYAFHALAIDEQRGPFEPTLWQCPEDVEISQERVQQVWFVGVHSNVGGSYEDAGLSDIALDWMITRVEQATDLTFDSAYRQQHIKPNAMGVLYDSLGKYVLSRTLPFERMIGGNPPDISWLSNLLRRYHRPGAGCRYVNEMIHRSVFERVGQDAPYQSGDEPVHKLYDPANLEKARGRLPIVEYDGRITPPER